MSPIRQQAEKTLSFIPEHKLKFLLPLLKELVEEDFVIETNLTPEEIAIFEKAEKEFNIDNYVPFDASAYLGKS